MALAALALAGGGAAMVADWGAGDERARSDTVRPQEPRGEATDAEAGAVAEEALSSVVAIEVGGRGVTGSGFRVGVDRIVVTGADAVGDAEAVSVVLRDGSRRTARVLGRAPGFDIAAIELADDSGVPAMHSGSGLAELQVGDRVLAVGAPGRVAAGGVSALSRRVRVRDGSELDALQTDITIDPASSGGPLINVRGDVVGVTTTSATPGATPSEDASPRAGFAIPVDVARREALAIIARG